MQIKSDQNHDRILIAIPAYNEQKNISNVLRDISKNFKNILVIDNNSQDSTIQEVKKFPVFLISHKYNLGKSESMKTALEFAKIKNLNI
jgi:glycosyltransferase involved in cell wall biosynthesis